MQRARLSIRNTDEANLVRARLTIQVTAPPNASLNVRVLDSAGEEAAKGSGSVGPAGGVIDLPLDVDVLLDDAERPLRLRGDSPLDDVRDRLVDWALVDEHGPGGTDKLIAAECAQLAIEARDVMHKLNLSSVDIHYDPATTGEQLREARAVLARRLARIEHLEARHAERAARVPQGSRAPG